MRKAKPKIKKTKAATGSCRGWVVLYADSSRFCSAGALIIKMRGPWPWGGTGASRRNAGCGGWGDPRCGVEQVVQKVGGDGSVDLVRACAVLLSHWQRVRVLWVDQLRVLTPVRRT